MCYRTCKQQRGLSSRRAENTERYFGSNGTRAKTVCFRRVDSNVLHIPSLAPLPLALSVLAFGYPSLRKTQKTFIIDGFNCSERLQGIIPRRLKLLTISSLVMLVS